MRVRIIGAGRAGRSFAEAWTKAGLHTEVLPRHASFGAAAQGVDAVLIATPDREIASVAGGIEPGDAAVLHCSGATGLAPVAHHDRHGSIHPLMALPDPTTGAQRLTDRGWFAIAGDEITSELVAALGGQSFFVDDPNRALYHATAAIAANHLVALLGQVERLAAQVGVPAQAFLDMSQASLIDVVNTDAPTALTGPAARGDQTTLDAHRAALPPDELALYNVLAAACAELAASEKEPDAGNDDDR